MNRGMRVSSRIYLPLLGLLALASLVGAARSLLVRALEIRQRTLGGSHPDTAQTQARIDALAAAP